VAGSPHTVHEVGGSLNWGALVGMRDGENQEKGDDGYSEVVLSAVGLAPSLGLSFGGNDKRLLELFSSLEVGQHREVVVLLLYQRGGGSLRIWNAPLTLMLEAVAQVRVMGVSFLGFSFCFFF
jgi:hypothetical protein